MMLIRSLRFIKKFHSRLALLLRFLLSLVQAGSISDPGLACSLFPLLSVFFSISSSTTKFTIQLSWLFRAVSRTIYRLVILLMSSLYDYFLIIHPNIKYMINMIKTLMKILNPLSLEFIMLFMQKYETTASIPRLNKIQNMAKTTSGFLISLHPTQALLSCINIFIFALHISHGTQ